MNMVENPFPFPGLNDNDVETSRKNFGSNQVDDNSNPIRDALLDVVREPMFILLMVCAAIYFILGEQTEAWFMTGAILLVSGISFFQDSRSRRATDALRLYTRRTTDVIRNNQICKVSTEEIVIGDYVIVSEGHLVPADGRIVQMNDLSVMESILTGESFPVNKSLNDPSSQQLFQGTIVLSGQAVMIVNAISKNTVLGKIAVSVDQMKKEKTGLQLQIDRFVFRMAVVGGFFFLLIWGYHFFLYGDIWTSLLQGLTIAMSVLPEEIPVAFSTFMALGAWRLLKSGIIVKKTQVVESLGAANILCVDKTGTITENSMILKLAWVADANEITDLEKPVDDFAVKQLIEIAMWASEPVPFDPMECSIHQLYSKITNEDKRSEYYMFHEYPLGGTPPAMTHVFKKIMGDNTIVACKGAPEFFLRNADLSTSQKSLLAERLKTLTEDGYRVLGVGFVDKIPDQMPDSQEKFSFNFTGLIAFYDPPKENIRQVIKSLEKAGIQLKIVTGDIPETAVAIARQAGMSHADKMIHAEDFRKMSDAEMRIAANENFIFTRMYPDLKLQLIHILKESGNTVGMTGDGVNDGPALKAADIGIAMGKRGTEIARDAASIILTDDDFGKMTEAVEMGRKIYINLKKAIRYIISIHIPIILTVAIPLFFGWEYLTLFTPVHIIFFELIMGPTCSIVYENEPIEKNIMLKPPRFVTSDFLNTNELMISVLQGLMITAGVLIVYRLAIFSGYGEDQVRTMLFLTLITSNILLTLVNRSFYYSVIDSLKYRNPLLPIIILITILLTAVIILFPSVAAFFKLCPLTLKQVGICSFIAMISVFWFELYKYYKRIHSGFEKENIHATA